MTSFSPGLSVVAHLYLKLKITHEVYLITQEDVYMTKAVSMEKHYIFFICPFINTIGRWDH